MPILLAASALLLLALLIVHLRRMREAAPSRAAELSVFRDLRQQLFTADPAELGIPDPVPGTLNGTWGVIMELGFPVGAASVVALGDGTASLYLETGGGMIGAGRHERVHRAALTFVEEADRLVAVGEPSEEPRIPSEREVALHWLTRRGVFSRVVPELELEAGHHPLSPLHTTGHALLAEMRSVGETADSV